MEDFERPCYVIGDKGVSYEDGWCYGPSRYLGRARDFALNHRTETEREIIKADIRKAMSERNGLPLYRVSDHGNVERVRAITLRRER